MSNQQTTDALIRGKQELENQDSLLVRQVTASSESINQISQQIEQISQQTSRLPFNSPERNALNQQARELDDRRRVLRAENAQLSQKILDIGEQIERIDRQISLSQSGPPNTNTTTPPVEGNATTPPVSVVDTQSRPEQLPEPATQTQPAPQPVTNTTVDDALAAGGVASGIAAPNVPVQTAPTVPLTPEQEQEARFEAQRQAAINASAQTADSSGAVPPVITQPAPPGIPNVPYDDETGQLNPGWVAGADGSVAYVGVDAAASGGASLTRAPEVPDPEGAGFAAQVSAAQTPDFEGAGFAAGVSRGITAQRSAARGSGTAGKAAIKNKPDWRVRLQLAPQANYLYKAQDPGILRPLISTNGVLFPYLPTVSVGYSAAYDAQSLTHTNYKILQYSGSSVDNVQVQGEFTAQSTEEANYMLAVIHFFRTITKMFYGQDQNPQRGIPPPLCYLTGFGEFQYSQHPLVITSFSYALPTEVDYIRADSSLLVPGTATTTPKAATNASNARVNRTETARVPAGGYPLKPLWQRPQSTDSTTYVPTKMNISFSAMPVVTRADISRAFSVRDFATGKLTRGRTTPRGRGFW